MTDDDNANAAHVFDYPERFVVGTVGQPGERGFYLQASGGGATVTVALEKAEVAALAQGMVRLLDSVLEPGERRASAAAGPLGAADRAPLDTPFSEDFRVNELSVAWDGERVLVEAGDGEDGKLRVALTAAEAFAFVHRAETVVAAGRPDCVLCGQPAGPTGHRCPRLN